MTNPDAFTRELNLALGRSAIIMLVFLLAVGISLFFPAGFDWRLGWIFLAVFIAQAVFGGWYLLRKNPEIFIARSKYQPGMKAWDKRLAPWAIVAFVSIFPVAGLDERWQWSHAPLGLVACGYAFLTLGMIAATWVMGANKFAEPGVRIQTERGHHVVETGPYAYVRHPMYLAMFFVLPGYALALGSYAALIPAGVMAALLVVRTKFEDAMLQAELPGYTEYSQRVRYRLLPGVW